MKTLVELINNNTSRKAVIQTVYLDFGARIKWDTIVIQETEENNSYQLLSPKEHELLINGTMTIEEASDLVSYVNR